MHWARPRGAGESGSRSPHTPTPHPGHLPVCLQGASAQRARYQSSVRPGAATSARRWTPVRPPSLPPRRPLGRRSAAARPPLAGHVRLPTSKRRAAWGSPARPEPRYRRGGREEPGGWRAYLAATTRSHSRGEGRARRRGGCSGETLRNGGQRRAHRTNPGGPQPQPPLP